MSCSRDRREELLVASRRSRARWVMDASWEDITTRRELSRLRDGSENGQKAGSDADIPVAESIKTVLDYLSFVSDDGDFLDVRELAMSLPETGAPEEYAEDSDSGLDSSDEEEVEITGVSLNAQNYSQATILAEINAATTKKNSTQKKEEAEAEESKSCSREEEERGGDTAATPKNSKFSEEDRILADKVPFFGFLRRLKSGQDPHTMAIVRSMQSFVTKIGVEAINANLKFDSERTQEDRHKAWARDIAQFVATTQQQMRVHGHMWGLASSSSTTSPSSSSSADTTSGGGGGGDEQVLKEEEEEGEEWKQACAHLEKLLYLKLHPTLFGRDANVSAADDSFFRRVQTLGFLTPEHFDVKSLGPTVRDHREEREEGWSSTPGGSNPNLHGADGPNPNPAEAFLRVPASHLRDLELCRTPSDMITCLKTVTLAIATGLKAARGGEGGDPGADELLPMLILALVRVQPKRIHSVLAFLNNYTAAGKMDTEAGYLITSLMSAVQFLDEVDASKLSIAAGEFEANIRRCQDEAWALTQSRHGAKGGGSGGGGGGGSTTGSSSSSSKGYGGSHAPFGSEEEESAFALALTATATGDGEGDGGGGDKALLRLMAKYTNKKTRR